MTIPRYMASTAASLSKNKTTTASKTPLKNKTPFQRGGRVSKIPRLETVNVKQLKPLLEQKADPLRAQELANLWTRPRGILKPFQSDLLIRPPPPKFDDEDEETGTPADVDEIHAEELLLVRRVVNGHPSTPNPSKPLKPIGSLSLKSPAKSPAKSSTPKRPSVIELVVSNHLETISVLLEQVKVGSKPEEFVMESAKENVEIDTEDHSAREACIDTFFETLLVSCMIESCRDVARSVWKESRPSVEMIQIIQPPEIALISEPQPPRQPSFPITEPELVVISPCPAKSKTPSKPRKTPKPPPKSRKTPKPPTKLPKPNSELNSESPVELESAKQNQQTTTQRSSKRLAKQNLDDSIWVLMKSEAVQTQF